MRPFALCLGILAFVAGMLSMIIKPEQTPQLYILGTLWYIIYLLEKK